jgi:hypothetical protein
MGSTLNPADRYAVTAPRQAPVACPRLCSNFLNRFNSPFSCIFTRPSASPAYSSMDGGS